ncbi:hypothetical protein BOTBODRAFT_204875 [Botryobasidium botryosum FD-172 SS1]|uniref:Uncharacterized protein n=1 Tax=Botryobasidium botryosum (strain FD-172 SS1) TaxID=930990 RepID=A0A067N0G0_BOTB1|nr:hypothetical protein BOTBODRAFT_204875 [Botryobasidium botryosum FD-172 SS1]
MSPYTHTLISCLFTWDSYSSSLSPSPLLSSSLPTSSILISSPYIVFPSPMINYRLKQYFSISIQFTNSLSDSDSDSGIICILSGIHSSFLFSLSLFLFSLPVSLIKHITHLLWIPLLL